MNHHVLRFAIQKALGVAALTCMSIVLTGCSRDTLLNYGDVTLIRRTSGDFAELTYSAQSRGSQLYFKYRNQEPKSIAMFSIEGLSGTEDIRQAKRPSGEVDCNVGGDTFVFSEGKLVYARISYRDEERAGEVRLARNAHGPYVSLPASREELERVLGRPDKVASVPTSHR